MEKHGASGRQRSFRSLHLLACSTSPQSQPPFHLHSHHNSASEAHSSIPGFSDFSHTTMFRTALRQAGKAASVAGARQAISAVRYHTQLQRRHPDAPRSERHVAWFRAGHGRWRKLFWSLGTRQWVLWAIGAAEDENLPRQDSSLIFFTT